MINELVSGAYGYIYVQLHKGIKPVNSLSLHRVHVLSCSALPELALPISSEPEHGGNEGHTEYDFLIFEPGPFYLPVY